jgi:hypothetical protein
MSERLSFTIGPELSAALKKKASLTGGPVSHTVRDAILHFTQKPGNEIALSREDELAVAELQEHLRAGRLAIVRDALKTGCAVLKAQHCPAGEPPASFTSDGRRVLCPDGHPGPLFTGAGKRLK